MTFDNPQITRLLESLRNEGFYLSLNWETRRDPHRKGNDIRHYTVRGYGDKRPDILTFVLIDYRENGYGLYVESGGSKITEDVERICGLEAGTASLVA